MIPPGGGWHVHYQLNVAHNVRAAPTRGQLLNIPVYFPTLPIAIIDELIHDCTITHILGVQPCSRFIGVSCHPALGLIVNNEATVTMLGKTAHLNAMIGRAAPPPPMDFATGADDAERRDGV